jgi:hypothetical protein
MLSALTFRRSDGTFVGVVNGLPYHVIPGDPHWSAAQALAAEMGDALPIEPPPPPAPPPTLTARQLRLGLLGMGVRAAEVEAAIAAIPDDLARETAWIEWEYATAFERDHALVDMLGASLGLDAAQIDAAWTQAARL